jgi:hypothetical protein
VSGFSWDAAYHSDLQSPFALVVVPLAYLAYRAAVAPSERRALVPEAHALVSRLLVVFAALTIVDPICTGPLSRALGIGGTLAGTLVMFCFVLLGDLRVLVMLAVIARPQRGLRGNLGWCLGLVLVVPAAAGLVYAVLGLLVAELHGQWLWIVYELGFLLLVVVLARRWVPRVAGHDPEQAALLKALCGYSAAYYALWAFADLVIVVGELDLGWAIRMVPNQLYYALWVPFVHARFYVGRSAPASSVA